MNASQFDLQRRAGEALLAAGWHAASIAVAAKPGSAWNLVDPTRRIRVRMSADLAASMAEITAASRPSGNDAADSWRLTVHHAPPARIVAGALNAPAALVRATGAERRAISRALESSGMRADRGRLTRALSGTSCWSGSSREAEAIWTAPSRTRRGGWLISTAAVLLEATHAIPAAVLVPLINPDPLAEAQS
ncbi:hypothetical protein Caci_6859 [Catenulispora acidiphila DSM 44928]|uniref:Uncharacterized protein n=1 Tax=Catenulispora acidiphila (strain DSM 44928 / JCM 14897 / NBRC 102108 / NRRL B-24433 / ID139908) TaxID=479433 RepID=C7Q1Z8_CATAD|nr:hypothetical protein [Catenulispora acidiphila]ACU75699.1 hypothetical protein Caci_6859 [Catenulispora acidiphila DSM 44928]